MRESDDMQFAFSYFHYIIAQSAITKEFNVFNYFDADQSG